MSDNPHDDLHELESAIHHLKEAQHLHDGEDYNPGKQDAAIDKVKEALDDIGEYVEIETDRLKLHSPVPLENE